MQPFKGIEQFKEFCKNLTSSQIVIEKVKEVTPAIAQIVVIPRSGLYDIYKRSTDLTINKCVGIGFTYIEAMQFIKICFKTKIDEELKIVVFYEAISQENHAAINPLWNSKEIIKEDKNVN